MAFKTAKLLQTRSAVKSAFSWFFLSVVVNLGHCGSKPPLHCIGVCGEGTDDETYVKVRGWCDKPERERAEEYELYGHAEGHIEILTILPIHRKFWVPSKTNFVESPKCVVFDDVRALERLEAVRLAVHIINAEKLLGGWTIGADVIDSCNSTYVAHKSLEERMVAAAYYMCSTDEKCDRINPDDGLPGWKDIWNLRNTSKTPVDDEDGSGAVAGKGSGDDAFDQSRQPCFFKAHRPERRSLGIRKLVIGPASNTVGEMIVPFARDYHFVQLGYAIDSSELNNREQFPHFFQTTPSLKFHAEAIAALLEKLEWYHVAVFASDDEYGNILLDSFLVSLKKKKAETQGSSKPSVCAALSGTFSMDDEEGTDDLLENAEKAQLKAIVLLASERHALLFLETAQMRNMSNLTWIGTSKWTQSSRVLQWESKHSFLKEDVLSVAPVPPMDSFVWKNWKKIKHLFLHRLRKIAPSPPLMAHNPFLRIFWEEHFRCYLTREASMAYRHKPDAPIHRNSYACLQYYDLNADEHLEPNHYRCGKNETLLEQSFSVEEARMIMHTFFVAAKGLQNLFNMSCARWKSANGTVHKFCEAFQNKSSKPEATSDIRQMFSCLLNDKALQKTFEDLKVTGTDPKQVAFLITKMEYNSTASARGGGESEEIAIWTPQDFQWLSSGFPATLILQHSLLANTSICAQNRCPPGTEQRYEDFVNTHSCCWSCRKCSGAQIRNATDEYCKGCARGFRPSQDRTTCDKLPSTFYTVWNTAWLSVVITISFLAGFGVLISLGFFHSFKQQLDSIKTTNYAFLLLQASALFLTVLISIPPSDSACTAQLLLLWPWPSALHANWILKNTNLWVIYQADKLTSQEFSFANFIGKFFAWMVAGWAVLFLSFWAGLSPPQEKTVYHNERVEVQCDLSTELTALYYAITLLMFAVVTVVAFRGRTTPSPLDEKKFVFTAALLTSLLWLFFLPATYILDKLGQTIILSLISTFQSVVIHVCLVCRPIYYIIFKNVNPQPQQTGSSMEMHSNMDRIQTSSHYHASTPASEEHTAAVHTNISFDTNKSEQHRARYIDSSQDDNFRKNLIKMEKFMLESADLIDGSTIHDSGLPPDDADQLEVVVFDGGFEIEFPGD